MMNNLNFPPNRKCVWIVEEGSLQVSPKIWHSNRTEEKWRAIQLALVVLCECESLLISFHPISPFVVLFSSREGNNKTITTKEGELKRKFLSLFFFLYSSLFYYSLSEYQLKKGSNKWRIPFF